MTSRSWPSITTAPEVTRSPPRTTFTCLAWTTSLNAPGSLSPVGGCLRKAKRSHGRLLAKGTVMTFDLERARPATLAGLAVALALLMPTEVLAQSSSRTFYDASGRVSGHSTTDSGGSTTIYDASERVPGLTAPSGNHTTVYDANPPSS